MAVRFTVVGRKKSPLDEIAERSGSHSRSGMRPTIPRSDVTRIVAEIERAEDGARQCSAPILLKATEKIISAITRIASGKGMPGFLSVHYGELCRIQQEAEEMKCTQTFADADFKRCEQKFREWKKRLDALEGLP